MFDIKPIENSSDYDKSLELRDTLQRSLCDKEYDFICPAFIQAMHEQWNIPQGDMYFAGKYIKNS